MQVKFIKNTGSHRMGKVASYPDKIAEALIKMKIAAPYAGDLPAKNTYNTRMMTAPVPTVKLEVTGVGLVDTGVPLASIVEAAAATQTIEEATDVLAETPDLKTEDAPAVKDEEPADEAATPEDHKHKGGKKKKSGDNHK